METGPIILILSFALPLIVVGVLLYFMKSGFQKQVKFADELREKISTAEPSTAIVISAAQGMTGGDINRIMHLNLQIKDNFNSSYIAKVTWFVNTLHFDKIKGGNEKNIKIDKDNKKIIYPADPWGKYTKGYENL